jgi:hypothetical protein
MTEERTYHPDFDDSVWESLLDGLLGSISGDNADLARIPTGFRQRMRRIAYDWMDLAHYVQKIRKKPYPAHNYNREVDDLAWEEVQEAFYAAIEGRHERGHLPFRNMWRVRRMAGDWLMIARHLQLDFSSPLPPDPISHREDQVTDTPTTPIITTPGKFEGEPRYTPYFWEATLLGDLKPDENGIYELEVTEEDVQKFSELKVGQRVLLCESDDGFVHTRLVTPIE